MRKALLALLLMLCLTFTIAQNIEKITDENEIVEVTDSEITEDMIEDLFVDDEEITDDIDDDMDTPEKKATRMKGLV